MAGRIRQEDVEAVRERTDIVKVVSDYLQLKKAGRDSLVGLCPFHPEKTPSFSVSPSKQVYYCFGCGEGGNVFKFVERLEGLSFAEVVETLAKEAGITLRYEGESTADRRAQGRRQVVHRAIGEAARLYHQLLLNGREGADARDYLARRGISQDSVERFLVGYAPGYADYLLRRMSKAYSVDLLVEAGLAAKDASGNLRDQFRGRVMFPIHDLSGHPVGFGGRLLTGRPGAGDGSQPPEAPPGSAGPKYVNSRDSAVYHKGSLLYNLNRAKADITRTGRAWMVEGYTDVIALDQAGVREVVATSGTALGEDHLRLLARFTDRLVLAFDSDDAGARAAERAFQFHERYPVDVSVLVLPQGQDPADFALARGEAAAEAFRALEDQATPLVVYTIERAMAGRNLGDVEEQSRAVKAGVGILARLDDAVRRERYARTLADLVGVSVESVMLEFQHLLAGGGDGQGSARPGGGALPTRPVAGDRNGPRATGSLDTQATRVSVRLRPSEKVEREVLKLLVQAPAMCGDRQARIDPGQFLRAEHRKAFELIRESWGTAGPSQMAMAQDRSPQLGSFLAELSVDPPETLGELSGEYVTQVFLSFEEFKLRREIDDLRKQLQKINPVKAPSEYEPLWDRFVKLEGARRRLREEISGTG